MSLPLRYALKTALPLIAAVLPALAGAACLPVIGTVKLLPDPTCSVKSHLNGAMFTGECYSVALNLGALPSASGFSGTTTEYLVGVNGVPTLSPAAIPSDANPMMPRQLLQTARSAVMIGSGARRTTLYTTDMIIIQPGFSATGQMTPGVVTEQILIAGTDGKGAYAGASGHLAVLGNSIGSTTPVSGKLCLPGEWREHRD